MNLQPFDPQHFTPQSGITLIEASAGTGKTYSITQIIRNLIAEGACRIDEVLVLTFTETATQELRERIRKAISDGIADETEKGNDRAITHLSNALDNFESASIFTIHGFCNRILREFAVEAGIGAEFAILKNTDLFEEELEIEVARQIQATSEKNPFIPVGIRALGLKTGFITQTLHLKESPDLMRMEKDPSQETLEDWFVAMFSKLTTAWQKDKNDIRAELLGENPPINRRRALYKPEAMTQMWERLDQAFVTGESYLSLFEDLLCLARAELTDGKVLRKNQTISSLGFYDRCDDAHLELQSFSELLAIRILGIRSQRIETLVYQEQTLRFDDLLTFARKIVTEPSGRFSAKLFNLYKVGLIDEFQDTDPVQFAILDQIFQQSPSGQSPRPLILIGDPKQAIYSFRGGDIFTYNSAKERAQQIYYLDTNWRSNPAINEGINELLSTSPHPFRFSWIGYQPVKTSPKNLQKCLLLKETNNAHWIRRSGIEWVPLEEETSDYQKIDRVAADISALLKSKALIQTTDEIRPLGPADVVVLVPDNRNGARIHEALGIRRVPSSIFGGASVFQTSDALQLYAVLNALLHPRDFPLVKGAVAGACFDPILASKDNDSTTHEWTHVLQSISAASQLWQTKGLSAALSYLSKVFCWKEHLSKTTEPHRSLANQQHLVDLLLDQEANASHDPHSLLRWFREHIEDPDSKDQDQLLQLDTDEAAVTIMTMHKSKGLEFPIVFIPFLPKAKGHSVKYPNQFHNPKSGELQSNFSKHFVTKSTLVEMEEEARSEALRILYVAITRAEISCRIYLQAEKQEESVFDLWLPSAAALQERIEQLQCKAQEEPLRHGLDDLPSTKLDNTASQSTLHPPLDPPLVPAPTINLSFTGIVVGATDKEVAEADEPLLFTYPTARHPSLLSMQELSIFDFDKGTNAGLFFHEILELADYSDSTGWEKLVGSKLEQFGYAKETWMPVILPWMRQLVTTPIQFSGASSLTLSELGKSTIFRETEFSYNVEWGHDTWHLLEALFEESTWIQNLHYQLPNVSVVRQAVEAFVNGVVDFWCLKNDKVYLMDWKSNFLGETVQDYDEPEVLESMNSHHYHLQYLLYICAINRYLRLIKPDYCYEDHFVGVGYCFLRGISDEQSNTGWFSCLPPASFIEEMESILHPLVSSVEKGVAR